MDRAYRITEQAWRRYTMKSIPTRPIDRRSTIIACSSPALRPQPVGFLSTVGSNGQKNLSPFSYFQLIDHDPPMFTVGFYHGRTA